jgi:hypothetical protein
VGPWTSDLMSAVEAATTAENAREGINDLRLIIQGRARFAQNLSAAPANR